MSSGSESTQMERSGDPPSTPEAKANAPEIDASERRFRGLALGLGACYLLLALSHGGEFWPFSRFPMFSNAQKPWLRATLRELRAEDLALPLREVGQRDLPGVAFALGSLGIDQNDLSELLRPQGDTLDAQEGALLQQYFPDIGARTLVLYRVRGRLREDGTPRIRYRPFALLHGAQVVPLALEQSAQEAGLL